MILIYHKVPSGAYDRLSYSMSGGDEIGLVNRSWRSERMAYKSIIVAIGTWLYDGKVPRKIELRARPATEAGSRWIEDETGRFVIDEATPIPATADGFVYYVGATSGGEFLSIDEARAWADRQPWGPVEWSFLPKRT